jgi:hypothetical protein
MADLAGASENQLRRLGSWNSQALEGYYLTSLPREAMRVLAGFPPTMGHFYLKRAAITPSEELQQQVFPEVDAILAKVETGVYEQTMAASAFLRLLCI